MRKWFLLVVGVMLAGVIAGCSKGSEYEGKWLTSVRSDWDGSKSIEKLDIKRNGENFIINVSTEQYKDTGVTVGEMGKTFAWKASVAKPVSATFKEGKLQLDPFTALTFVKSDGTILGPRGNVYKKDTPAEFNQLKTEATETYKKLKPQMVIVQ